MITWNTVRQICGKLPGAEETTSYGTPAFKVRGKLMVRVREDDVLAVRVDLEGKEALLARGTRAYFTVPHYDGYPVILVRMKHVRRMEIAELLEDAWRKGASRKQRMSLEGRRR